MRRLWMVISCLLLSTAANAEYSVKEYREMRAKKDDIAWAVFRNYINGVGTGYQWANEFVAADHKARYFCQPQRLSMNADNYISIIDGMLMDMSNVPETQDVELLLWHGLRKTFPCP